MNRTIYLDNAATTSLDHRVLETMIPFLKNEYGNASSIHHLGRQANVAVEEAREKIANQIGAQPKEVVFTSGGTESDNSAIKGVLRATGKTHIITSNIEHHAILHTVESLKSQGFEASILPVNEHGIIDPENVEKEIREETGIVSFMHANNEIGAINPLSEIAEVSHRHGVMFHSDTVQSMGKIPINVDDLGVDFLSVSAHKIYGPKGVGFMYIRNGSPFHPFMEGGAQERRRRGGTLNVAGIVGLGKAVELVVEEMDGNTQHISGLQQRLINGLKERFPELASFNSDPENGLYNMVNVSFPLEGDRSLDGEMLLLNLDIEGICCSNGSACTSGAIEPSHVLTGIGRNVPTAKSSVRFSIGKDNTVDEIDYTLDKLEKIVARMLKTI